MTMVDRVEEVENCLDSSRVREVFLSVGVDEEVMRRVSHRGRLQYFPHFPKPYFRIERKSQWVIQGVIGALSLRVTLSPSTSDDALAELRDLIEGRLTSDGVLN